MTLSLSCTVYLKNVAIIISWVGSADVRLADGWGSTGGIGHL